MSPRSEALAYRIWGYCEPRGWDCTFREVGEALGRPANIIGRICRAKGWTERLRCARRDKPARREIASAPGFIATDLRLSSGERLI